MCFLLSAATTSSSSSSLALWGVGEGLWWYLLPVYIEGLGATPVQIGFGALRRHDRDDARCLFRQAGSPIAVSRRPIMIGGWVMGTIAILLLAVAPDLADGHSRPGALQPVGIQHAGA